MMNRALYYFKNIKFNSSVNRVVANRGKTKYTNKKNSPYHIPVRKFTSYNIPPDPNNNSFTEFIIAAIICGSFFQYLKR